MVTINKKNFGVTLMVKLSSKGQNTLKLIKNQIIMGSEVIIVPILMGIVFGVFYLHYSTRNKERMALIEKGADASIFNMGKSHAAPFWQVLPLNGGLLLMGIGAGVIIGGLISEVGVDDDIAMPGSIFLFAGIGLLIGFFLTRKLVK